MVFEKVKEIMVNTLGCDEEAIVMEANIKEDLGIDSLDAVELVMAIEEELGVKITDEELAGMKLVSDIANCVEKHQA